jgi:mannose-6-phosphate isomerase-like protein (cupin superfamily)
MSRESSLRNREPALHCALALRPCPRATGVTTVRRVIHTRSPILRADMGNQASPVERNAVAAGVRTDELEKVGFSGPVRLLDPPTCREVLRELRADPPNGRDWAKDAATSSRVVYELAAQPAIVGTARALLGPDVVVWGASLVVRGEGDVHPWHTDIESSARGGGALSVWIGLENVRPGNALRLASYSHLFGATLQETAAARGVRRDEVTPELVARWAAELDPTSEIAEPDVGDGDALFFDGRIWHGTAKIKGATRTALLLQYARASYPVRIPDFSVLEWPFSYRERPRPACIRVAGESEDEANRIAPPPPRTDTPPVRTGVWPVRPPYPTDPEKGWKPYNLFRGTTPNLGQLTCHFSVLAAEHSPHPPHEHAEEELLLVLDGEADLVLVASDEQERRHRVRRGQIAYYPAWSRHTLRTPAGATATYLMFKWVGRDISADDVVAVTPFDTRGEPTERPFSTHPVFEHPTRYLERLHCHTSTLRLGAGYAPHRDDHDVAIVVLDGEIEVLDERLAASDVLFVPAGEEHGMHNPSAAPAHYLVLEFRGRSPHDVGETGFQYPVRLRRLDRLRVDVDDSRQAVVAHRGRGAREHRRCAARERPRRVRLRQQLRSMAAAKAQKRGGAKQLSAAPCQRRA